MRREGSTENGLPPLHRRFRRCHRARGWKGILTVWCPQANTRHIWHECVVFYKCLPIRVMTLHDLKALSTMIQGKLTAASKVCNTCYQTSLTKCPPRKAETLRRKEHSQKRIRAQINITTFNSNTQLRVNPKSNNPIYSSNCVAPTSWLPFFHGKHKMT